MTRAYFVGWLVAVTQLRVEGKKVSSGPAKATDAMVASCWQV